jgi:predicted AlkP superfamily pyrophosphatase or phosphodiesterase
MVIALLLVASACPQPVVLVTIDGVRPDEVWSPSGPDLLPNLHRLAARGMAWPEARASGPVFMSMPGYHEIITGRPDTGRYDDPTLLDEVDSAVVASWDWIARMTRRVPISAGRNAGHMRDNFRVSPDLDDAVTSPAFPGVDDYRPDRYTAPLALAVLQERRPCFFWISLGDTDEYAHRGDYPSYLEALRAFDAFLGDLDATLAAMKADPIVIVTADHGRNKSFVDHGVETESSRVWIVVAGGPIVPLAPVEIGTLCQIAPLLRRALGLPRDLGECAPLSAGYY